jgi:hypothetical protein
MRLLNYSFLVLMLVGCASTGNANVKNQELLSQVQMEKSTKADVRRLLGEPNDTMRMSSTVGRAGKPSEMVTLVESWTYVHASAQTSPAAAIPFIGMFFMNTTSESAYFQVGFDAKGIVQQITQGQNKTSSGLFNSQ